MPRLSLRLLIPFLALLPGVPAFGHPLPDIPVRAAFEEGGRCQIQVEVDPRCFEADPNMAPSVLHDAFLKIPEAQRTALKNQAQEFVENRVALYFEPLGQVTPDFAFEFTTQGGAPLAKLDDVVVITGTWQTTVPAGIQGYRIKALREAQQSVLFLNTLKGRQVERMQALFPNESSFLLDLTGVSDPAPKAPGDPDQKSAFVDSVQQGFSHVLPRGLDHILFILALLLLSREWRPLLWQMGAFTAAHAVALGLATQSWVRMPGSIVEPVIALSIAAVALENLLLQRLTPWRLVIVFAFGLVDALAFADTLRGEAVAPNSLVVRLLGFNIGVEGGQLAVLALGLLATFGFKDPGAFRRYVVIPGSVAIAVTALWWAVSPVVT